MTEPSLYDRLGGAFAIAAVIDHFSDAVVRNPIAGQGPVVGVEAVGAGALAQRGIQVVELLVGQARVRPGGAAACQRLQSALVPAGMPAADVLAGHTELVGDLGLRAAGGEQFAGLETDRFKGLAVTHTAALRR